MHQTSIFIKFLIPYNTCLYRLKINSKIFYLLLATTNPSTMNPYLEMKEDKIKKYVEETTSREPEILKELREYTNKNVQYSLMTSDITATQLIRMLLKMNKSKRCIEVGTYTGYNVLNCAITIPEDGEIIALDINEDYVKHGYPFFEKAGVRNKIKVKIGPAVESLDSLIKEGQTGTFDFVYIDAHKPEYKDYVERSHVLLKQGGIIVLDNMLQAGQVIEPHENLQERYKDNARVIDELNRALGRDERFDIVLLGIDDGVTILYKL